MTVELFTALAVVAMVLAGVGGWLAGEWEADRRSRRTMAEWAASAHQSLDDAAAGLPPGAADARCRALAGKEPRR